ncbi:hypothetical protein [Spirillospora sp. CA-294931]|uniref:hypothetical protein n=1 Tax=Spirillospora sp. CA-294931 TaxID=3240042 RepID=UPI003D948466
MSVPATLVFAEAVRPEELRELVVSLGGTPSADPEHSQLQRDDGCVWVIPSDWEGPMFSAKSGRDREIERALGGPPGAMATMEISHGRGSEWLAAEIVLAAAERWRLVLLDRAETVVTVEEFNERLAKRPTGFFWPDGTFDFQKAARSERADPVTLLLPNEAAPEQIRGVLRSFGAQLDPDERTDAEFTRAGAHVWIYLDAEVTLDPFKGPIYRDTVGRPPYAAIRLDVFGGNDSETLAMELIEALAAHWPVLAQGEHGQLMTLDDLRTRAVQGSPNLFAP